MTMKVLRLSEEQLDAIKKRMLGKSGQVEIVKPPKSGPKPNKFHNVHTEVDGVHFASKKEAQRYSQLKLLEKAKLIHCLVTQPEFILEINGVRFAKYIGDFEYLDVTTGRRIVEDVKGVRTPVYRLKKKLVRILLGVEITEV